MKQEEWERQVFTVDTVIDSLKKFNIDETTVLEWEEVLGLNIPSDAQGQKQYSPHHINLFKNIKKHLALGRTLEEIRTIIELPPIEETQHTGDSDTPVDISQSTQPKVYGSSPQRPAFNTNTQANRSADVVNLIDKLVDEKDKLQQRLSEAEKLNSHLYNANNLYQRKVDELKSTVKGLSQKPNEDKSLKLLDEKSKLHEQLIELEKVIQSKHKQLESREKELNASKKDIKILINRIGELTKNFDPRRFCGTWDEKATLVEVVYDNFGINIESERARVFRIADPPERTYGNTAVITTNYEYTSNNLWKRSETLMAVYLDGGYLKGQLISEYIIDGVPVAKAVYAIECSKKVAD